MTGEGSDNIIPFPEQPRSDDELESLPRDSADELEESIQKSVDTHPAGGNNDTSESE